MKLNFLVIALLIQISCFGVAKSTTATVGTWSPAGAPSDGDVVTISHDWSAGYAATGDLANAFTGDIIIENGGYLKITNALANFAGTLTIESGGTYDIDGDMTNWTADIDVQSGGTFIAGWNFDAGDDASGASLTVNGELILTGDAPQGVLTVDLVVGGTGRIYARTITLNGNGSTGTTSLPVELISFTAESNKTENVLNWTTASEVNNSHFEIQKSDDGVNFQSIGIVQGNGNSSEVNHYSFIDLNNSNNSYYRLKQIDFDGGFEYSHVVNTTSLRQGIIITQKENSNEFYVLTPNQEELIIQVVDIQGRILMNKEIISTEGGRFNFNIDQSGLIITTVHSGSTQVSKQSIIK